MEAEVQTDTEIKELLADPDESQEEVVDKAPQEEAVVEAQPPQEEEKSVQALRFNNLRAARDKAEEEADAYRRKLERYERQQQAAPEKKEVPQQNYSIAPDDLVEGKHLSQYDQKLNSMKKEQEELKQQLYMNNVETMIKSECPDFTSVVNPENLAILRQLEPVVSTAIHSSSDTFASAVTAYKLIKKYGIAGGTTKNDKNIERVRQNASKPRPIASLNKQNSPEGPIAKANAFAEDSLEAARRVRFAKMNQIISGG